MKNLLRPLALRIGKLRWLPRFLPQIMKVDTGLQWLTAGRIGLLDIAGLTNLMLTVPGRKSGRPFSTPLLCAPRGDKFLVAGSNWGQPAEPQWAQNLSAAGTGVLRFRGRAGVFSAKELTGPERQAAWGVLLETWPNFSYYQSKTTRPIRVFELAPKA